MGDQGKLIGVCVDDSKHAARAFDWYVENVHRAGFKLAILHVHVPPPMPSVPMYPGAMTVNVEWSHELEESITDSRKLIGKYKQKCNELKIPCVTFAESDQGSPGETLTRLATSNNVSMLIMGSRGLGTVRRTFLGSVSDYVVHHMRCPVTVIPPPAKAKPTD